MTSSGGARRIAVVHGYYSSRVPSGENVVVDLQVAALREAGSDVEVYSIAQDEAEQASLYPLRAAARAMTGRGPAPAFEHFDPDVVHVHNLFPNFGRRWVRRHGGKLVATLHNFRPICPAATLFRDGGSCTECPDSGSAWPALRHGCYKSSRVATAPVALGTRMAADPVLSSAARLIVLSDIMRDHYAAVGVDPARMVRVPNFVVDDGDAPCDAADRSGWVYVGRLTPEKGIDRLVAQWPADQRLVVLGDGPLLPALRATATPGVEFRGSVTPQEVRGVVARARGLVFPSLWPEGLPTVYLEALAAGTPVLASPESVVGSLVALEGTGAVMSGDLSRDLADANRNFGVLAGRCRSVFTENYSQGAWLRAIGHVYDDVCGRGGS